MRNTKKIIVSSIVLAVAAASYSSAFARVDIPTAAEVKNSLSNDITVTQVGGNMCLMGDGFEKLDNNRFLLKSGTTGVMNCTTPMFQKGRGAKFDVGQDKSIAFFNPNTGSPHVDGYRGDIKDFEIYHGYAISNFMDNDYSGIVYESVNESKQSMNGVYQLGADITTAIPFSVKMPNGGKTYINIGTTAPF
ncbi:hypothetical protein [Cysteiniphilum litorale]|uniref:Secreted protein n=2 Tax=Cysteiniphilum TaxID=2056696 RepID=A0A8J2Z2T4_9GAMM|nr:hypothetical protein [Cysteiniphilum litorale]GGF88467.1 hypothetical protein GCM10010995_02120 [Cysteiniphilum litorale]